jgi:hypothetical protein
MIQSFLRVFALAFFSMAMAMCGFAEDNLALRVHVPFSFVAGEATLPAGDYTVQQNNISGIVMLQNQSAKNSAAVLSSNGSSLADGVSPKLVFENRGNKKVLTQILMSNAPSRVLPSSPTSPLSH